MQVETTKESTSTKVKQTPQEPTQQQQKSNVPESQQSTPASKQVFKKAILHQNKQHRNLNM